MTIFLVSNTSVDSTSVGSVNSSAGSGSVRKTDHLCEGKQTTTHKTLQTRFTRPKTYSEDMKIASRRKKG